jgi:hypothetical protein
MAVVPPWSLFPLSDGFFSNVFFWFRYLIDTRWYKQLKRYLGLDFDAGAKEGDLTAHPGCIDNGPLFTDNAVEPGEIRDHLVDELDYSLVSDEGWKALVDEFGLTEGQTPISRKVCFY